MSEIEPMTGHELWGVGGRERACSCDQKWRSLPDYWQHLTDVAEAEASPAHRTATHDDEGTGR